MVSGSIAARDPERSVCRYNLGRASQKDLPPAIRSIDRRDHPLPLSGRGCSFRLVPAIVSPISSYRMGWLSSPRAVSSQGRSGVSSVRRRDQFADVVRIDELALKAYGEIATAAVLAKVQENLDTIGAATDFALKNPMTTAALLSKDLHFRWISEAIATIRKRILELNFKKIGTYDAASQSTKEIFENVIKEIDNDLTRATSGIYPCIESIFGDDKRYNKYSPEALNSIKNIKLIADDIQRLAWRIQRPYLYVIKDRRLIFAFIAAFVIAVPIWYFIGAHGQSIDQLSGQQSKILISEDVRQLRDILEAQNKNIFAKAAYVVHFAWESLLVVPSIFLVPAAILSLARKHKLVRGKALRRSERIFGDIGIVLQRALPDPPNFISVEAKMTGDIITTIATGENIQQYVKTKTIDSYNSNVKGKYEADVDSFLNKVASTVAESGDKDAAEHYDALVNNLKDDKKSMARTMWHGLLKILPPVGEIAGAAAAAAKLFGAA
jgi:hypothetical protein